MGLENYKLWVKTIMKSKKDDNKKINKELRKPNIFHVILEFHVKRIEILFSFN